MSTRNNQPAELATFEGERGMPSVNEDGSSRTRKGLFFVALLIILGLGIAAIYWKSQQRAAKADEAKQTRAMAVTSAVPTRTFTDPPALPTPAAGPAPAEAAAPRVPAPAGSAPNTPPALPGSAGAGSDGTAQRPVATLDKSSSGLMAVTQKSASSRDAGGPAGLSASGGPEGGPGGLGGPSPQGGGNLSSMLSSTRTPARKAGHLGDRNFMLAKGSFIDCALQTKLESTVPGMTACVVTRNIYSDNGKVLLVERGSTITGEYQSNLRQGMRRIFVLWSRIKTPNGVVINLDSPGTDALGASGLPGYVDNHFWERFSGALLLSLVDDTARLLTQNGSSNSQQIRFSSAGEASSGMAAEALKNTINIPPTLYKNQGEQVGVYVARDLDFSSVYDVAPANE
ncbi:MAG: TrbI/VirB10 family protein [Pseudomonas sp.]|nr:MAG: TrbI/VirB10 family protein [Pseudomonas sp.]